MFRLQKNVKKKDTETINTKVTGFYFRREN